MKSAYDGSGVNIDTAEQIKKLIGKQARLTYRPEVLSGVGFFGSLFEFKGYTNPVLVSSADGVGTKLKLAAMLNRYDTVGMDIVNHSVNDILTTGAEPLYFLDYIAMGKLVPERIEAIVGGLARACRDAGCALIGGETAEMPGMYAGDDFDLVGFITGAVEKDRIINGSAINAGDVALGLPSSGLHTNGYSLVRKIFSREDMTGFAPDLGRPLGDT
ncbi:MAG: phosphoribosylformylglycinamidine cyclo-ligase, partial [Chloroflexi bacterium]|nr:phosphoribosylformylglycinamidine cyclo-ligase [Chloroflexota bacterium]